MLITAWSVVLPEKPVPPSRTPTVLPTMSTIAAPAVSADPRAIGLVPVSAFSWSRKMTGLIAAPSANGTTSPSRLLIAPLSQPLQNNQMVTYLIVSHFSYSRVSYQ